MNFIQKMFLVSPAKRNKERWYMSELEDADRETLRLMEEFYELNEKYARSLGEFEASLTRQPIYELYIDIKNKAQKLSFLWERIEYKIERKKEMERFLSIGKI